VTVGFWRVTATEATEQQVAPPEPGFTPFENEFSDTAEAIYRRGGTGYQWSEVDQLLREELGDLRTRCKRADGSGRAANVLTESNDKEIDLYMVFIGPNYERSSFIKVAEDRIRRFPRVKTVAVADKRPDEEKWRVRSLVERSGIGRAASLRRHFPAVTDEDVHVVEAEFDADELAEGVEDVPAVDVEQFAMAMAAHTVPVTELSLLPADLIALASESAVSLDYTTAVDALAATLSSQFVLFAGPSGTGKSTLARLLARFFAPRERWAIVEARRQWLGPEDLFGYFSVMADYFASTPDTETIVRLHESSVALMEDPVHASPPILVVEEINLSSIEGYLAPFMHGFSTPSAAWIGWQLHSKATGAVDADRFLRLPRIALLGPFLRCFGTINVDATALAPARKVAARASVMLLEPQDAVTPEAIAGLADTQEHPDHVADDGIAASYIGNPRSALDAMDEAPVLDLSIALASTFDALSPDQPMPVSRRDMLRCMLYGSYLLALIDPDRVPVALTGRLTQVAAENAVLHCVLPTLPLERFAVAVNTLLQGSYALLEPPDSETVLGGLLKSRLHRLQEATESALGFGDTVDFWSALS
jgi:energy-coupling factor transporter ATP-binding protein EcfA2